MQSLAHLLRSPTHFGGRKPCKSMCKYAPEDQRARTPGPWTIASMLQINTRRGSQIGKQAVVIPIKYERNLKLCTTCSLRAGKLGSVPLMIHVFFELQRSRESLCTGDTLGFSMSSMDGKLTST